MRVRSSVGSFELLDDESTSASAPNEPWTPPHWIPSDPVPPSYDISASPWIRPPAAPLTFVGVNLVDTAKARILRNMTVSIAAGLVTEIKETSSSDLAGGAIQAEGLYLCPGLIDCHTHVTSTPGMGGLFSLNETECALKATYVLKGMLARGFTTVRDVGGANAHLKAATAEWLIPGPRLLQGGPIMSQTGGHGDMGAGGGCCLPPAMSVSDGVDACLKTARTIMKNGADHIKICSSGGVASPTDRLESSQFTVEEIKAICDTVRMMGGVGVTAHCFTVEGARNAIEAGIWGIEHGNLLDEETLKLMKKKGVHLTPTLIVCDLLSKPPYNALIPPSSREKLTHVMEQGYTTLKKAHEIGVNVAYGTDCFASMQPAQLSEFDLRARVLPSPVILQQATVNAARVLKMEGQVGVIEKGAFADLLLLGANPLEDVTILNKPNEYLRAVVKDGRCVHSRVKGLAVEVPLV